MSKKLTTEEFIKKAQLIHGVKYDYSIVIYKDAFTKIKIICPTHGEFLKTPHDHISRKVGCVKCSNKEKLNTELFLQKANEIHKDFYDYSLVKIINNKLKIKIICPIHDVFEQSPKDHINGRGCIKCSGKSPLSNEIFVSRAIQIHGNEYDYSLVNYVNSCIKVKILCRRHGEFEQLPHKHMLGAGCPKCTFRVSKLETQWLNFLNIPQEYRQYKLEVNGKKVFVDGFDAANNIIYEFYGDYWHGNPKLYSSEDINPTSKKTFGELYNLTINKKKILENAGFKVVEVWESDFMKYITVVGCGAIGSHFVQIIRNTEYSIRIIDFDKVEVKNVHSQFYSKSSVGKLKVNAIKQLMDFIYGRKVEVIGNKLTKDNVDALLSNSALVVDCLDNGISRTVLQEYVRKNNIPCIHGALAQDGSFGRVVWDENFTIDYEPTNNVATDGCETGIHLPFNVIVSSHLAYSAQEFLKNGKKFGYQVHPNGSFKI